MRARRYPRCGRSVPEPLPPSSPDSVPPTSTWDDLWPLWFARLRAAPPWVIAAATRARPGGCQGNGFSAGREPAADDLAGFNYLHLNGSEAEINDTYRQCLRGYLPARPLLVVSQTTPVDPSRAPPGKHVMRVHVRTVPSRIEGDAAVKIAARAHHCRGRAGAWRFLESQADLCGRNDDETQARIIRGIDFREEERDVSLGVG